MPGKALSLQILKARWNLFGHIFRRGNDIPANKAREPTSSNMATN